MDDLLELLQEAENLLKEQRSIIKPYQTESISWIYSPGVVICRSCRRIYKGTLFHASHTPTEQYVLSCPRCPIDEKLWWLHHKLELQEVIEPIEIEQQAQIESLNDITMLPTRPQTGKVY